MPVLRMKRSVRYLRKLAGWVTGSPMYSSRWNISTRFQSMPGVAVRNWRKSIWEAPVAAMRRTVSELARTRWRDLAACLAAVEPTSVLLGKTFTCTERLLGAEYLARRHDFS